MLAASTTRGLVDSFSLPHKHAIISPFESLTMAPIPTLLVTESVAASQITFTNFPFGLDQTELALFNLDPSTNGIDEFSAHLYAELKSSTACFAPLINYEGRLN